MALPVKIASVCGGFSVPAFASKASARQAVSPSAASLKQVAVFSLFFLS